MPFNSLCDSRCSFCDMFHLHMHLIISSINHKLFINSDTMPQQIHSYSIDKCLTYHCLLHASTFPEISTIQA
jgi:hypothetical protein